ncbi:MAG: hypothetical protein SPI30_05975 [Prevotella sp.]|nr:hypothetical protein [Prevotella sp.]
MYKLFSEWQELTLKITTLALPQEERADYSSSRIVHERLYWFRLNGEQMDCVFFGNAADYAEEKRQTRC